MAALYVLDTEITVQLDKPSDGVIKFVGYCGPWLLRLLPAIQGSRKRAAQSYVVLGLDGAGALDDIASVSPLNRPESLHVTS